MTLTQRIKALREANEVGDGFVEVMADDLTEILDALEKVVKALEKIKPGVTVEHNCEECGCFTEVAYEIRELKEARKTLKEIGWSE